MKLIAHLNKKISSLDEKNEIILSKLDETGAKISSIEDQQIQIKQQIQQQAIEAQKPAKKFYQDQVILISCLDRLFCVLLFFLL